MSVTIHGVGKSRAMRNLWMAEELGLPYTHDPIDFRGGDDAVASLRAINDLAQVPVLTDGEFVLTESLAINLYLAKKAGGPLAPRDLREDALMMKWTLFGATQLEAPCFAILAHSFLLPEAQRDAKVLADSLAKVARPLAHLNKALASDGYLVGGRFTAADVNVGACIFFLRMRGDVIDQHPALAAWWSRTKERAAFQTALRIRGD